MPLRKRLGIVAGAAVAVAVVIAAIVCYTVVRGQLLGQVDSSLRAQAVAVQSREGQLALRGGDLAGPLGERGRPRAVRPRRPRATATRTASAAT